MHDEPPNPALPASVYKFKADEWQPPGYDPVNWVPPLRALRKLARREADPERFVIPPLFPCGRANWLRLNVGLLEGDWLLAELTQEEADEAIFSISCQAGYALADYPWDLVVRFVEACVALYESNRAFHTDGSSKWMLWDNLRLSWGDEPAQGSLQDLMLDAMLRVLALDDREAKEAALHGLGHHKDERARPAIQALIDSTADDELREYARDAYHFRVA